MVGLLEDGADSTVLGGDEVEAGSIEHRCSAESNGSGFVWKDPDYSAAAFDRLVETFEGLVDQIWGRWTRGKARIGTTHEGGSLVEALGQHA